VDPADYALIIDELSANHGAFSLGMRYRLAQKAFEHTAGYDRAIADFLGAKALADVENCYNQ
jgi:phosphoribosylaminoimidazolecarboxamide formyltransferase/IMP cyclohydrolase